MGHYECFGKSFQSFDLIGRNFNRNLIFVGLFIKSVKFFGMDGYIF